MSSNTIQVLDKGSVGYMDHMGTDLSVVNAARVSFDKESEWAWECLMCGDSSENEVTEKCGQYDQSMCDVVDTLSSRDTSLIYFVARGLRQSEWDAEVQRFCDTTDPEQMEKMMVSLRRRAQHWAPFSHAIVSLRVKAPVFVVRQLVKHKVGFAESEVSLRYIKHSPERYVPAEWRGVPEEGVKQGSKGKVDLTPEMTTDTELQREDTSRLYEGLLRSGVAPELARIELPFATYTEWIWPGSIAAFARMFNQRTDSHAQWESQEYARAVGEIIAPMFPVSWEALCGGGE